jgi:hypothetical protein
MPSRAPSARQANYRRHAEQSLITGATEPSGVLLARRVEQRQRAERGVVSELSGASSPKHRAERSMVSQSGGSWSASQVEHGQRAERSIVTEASGRAEHRQRIRASGARSAEHRAERSTAKWSNELSCEPSSEPSGASSVSRK